MAPREKQSKKNSSQTSDLKNSKQDQRMRKKSLQTRDVKSKRKRSIVVICCIVVLCVLAAITVLWSMQQRGNKKDQSDQTPSAQTMQTADPAETQAPAEIPVSYVNPLTGEACDAALLQKRPVAVMINNIYTSWPQFNTSRADIIYECEVEGGLTRLMAIYSDIEQIKDSIGSVRSAREYYLDFAADFDALFVHAGGADTAYSEMRARNTEHLDGVNGGVEGKYYVRDPRRSYLSYEHQLCITGENVIAAATEKGLRTTATPNYAYPFHFVSGGQDPTAAGQTATEVQTPFSAVSGSFTYDTTTQKYLRYEYDTAQTDALNDDVQLAFDNIVIIFCPYSYTGDAKGHIEVQTTGSGEGYYISHGKAIPITWSRTEHDAPMTLLTANGTALEMNPGKTFVCVMNTSRKADVTFG